MIEQITSNFSFTALWSPFYMLTVLLIIIGYYFITGKYRYKFKESAKVSFLKKFSFTLGMIIFYLGFGGPLFLSAHIIFSAHMTQMALVYLTVPPLLLAGLPVWLVKSFINLKYIRKPFHILSSPLVALILFNGFFSIYHVPGVYDFLMTSYVLDVIYLTILFISALFMWWPITCPVPELDSLIGLKKLAYILGNGVLLTPACALIIFSGSLLYDTYSDPTLWATALGFCLPSNTTISPELFDTFRPTDPLDDQQLGGIIMKTVQELIYGLGYVYAFFQWFRREKEEHKDELSMNPPHLQPKRT